MQQISDILRGRSWLMLLALLIWLAPQRASATYVDDKSNYSVSLVYYCQKLNHIFTLTDRISLSSDATTGIDEDYIPEFTRGSAKYPVVKTANVESMMARAGITAVSDNVVGAFVGDECRGVTTLSAFGMTQLVVFGRSAGESVTLKYYDSGKKILYTIADAMKM